MNGPYPEITNISFLAKLFFKTFISLKHLSDYRTIGPSDYRTVELSDCRIIDTAPFYPEWFNRGVKFVNDFVNDDGSFLTLDQFSNKFGFCVNFFAILVLYDKC